MSERPKPDDILEVEIVDLAATGKSVGKCGTLVVMVDAGLPGELIECRIVQMKRRFAVGKQLRVLREAENTVEPTCRHFAVCGGCRWQNLPYADQLEYKSRFVCEALKRIGKLTDVAIDAPIGCDQQFFYRNKMEYSFACDDGNLNLGLHLRGRWDSVFDIEECLLQSEKSVEILKTVRRLTRQLQIPFFNYQTGEGELRFLVLREGKLTGDLMLNLVTFNHEFEQRDELFESIKTEIDGITSCYHTVNGKKAHVASGEVYHQFGETSIKEKIGDLIFEIAPFSFFQTNSEQTKVLYDLILEQAAPEATDNILDLYCGCGSIGLYLAGKVNRVVGVETNESAVEMAGANARLNGIENTEFIVANARKTIEAIENKGIQFDTVITDPPRAGMEKKGVRMIALLAPRRIVAVSCNPATLARDLNYFGEYGYHVTRVTPVDMFPQTPHIETVVTLERD